MSVQPLKTSDTLAYPGGARDAHRSCHPQSLSAAALLPAAVAVRSRATVDACPTPPDKPRHAHSPDRLPVNFSYDVTLSQITVTRTLAQIAECDKVPVKRPQPVSRTTQNSGAQGYVPVLRPTVA